MDWEEAQHVFSKALGLTSDKLAPKTEKCLFVGYPKETKGYYFYNPNKNKVFFARKLCFLKRSLFSRKTVGVM